MHTFQFPQLNRLLLTAALSLLAFAAPAPAQNNIAVVVRPDVPATNLTVNELRALMLGNRQFWNSNLRVTLLAQAPGAHEREVMLKNIYLMSEAQFQQYWIAKVFRADATSGPRTVSSNEMAAQLALSIPGAIAYMDASQIPAGLKVLKINGLLPGDKGYPLR